MKSLLLLSAMILSISTSAFAGTFEMASCDNENVDVHVVQISISPENEAYTSISIRNVKTNQTREFRAPLDESVDSLSFTIVGLDGGVPAKFTRQGSHADIEVSGESIQRLICYRNN